jgi:thiamine biosynthesis protein ThiI
LSPAKSEILFDTVIVRLGGEIGIKSAWTRRTYEKRLIKNTGATLKHHNIPSEAIIRQQGRIYIKTSQAQKAAERLTRVFGISSLSPANQTTDKLEDITAQVIKLAEQKLRKQNTFAVRCRRVGTHSYTSREVCQQAGRQILDAFQNLQLKVNLTNPDVTLGIEIRENQAFIFTETITASDGLPVGTQLKTIALMEASLNSLVASWLTMKRGCPLVPAHFVQNQGKSTIKQIENVCNVIFEWSFGHPTKLYLIPHNQNLNMLKQECASHLLSILNKRLIYRIALQVAEKERAEGIVTGEVISEKPYQTLRCFRVQDQAIRGYPVHRPLAGLSNVEIEKLGQKIGIPKSIFLRPRELEATKPRRDVLPTMEEVEAVESRFNMQDMIDETMNRVETMTL